MLLGSGAKRGSKEGEPPKEYRLSPLETEMVKSIEEKTGQVGIDVNVTSSRPRHDDSRQASPRQHRQRLRPVHQPQFGNAFRKVASGKNVIDALVFRTFHNGHIAVLTPDELASIYTCRCLRLRRPTSAG